MMDEVLHPGKVGVPRRRDAVFPAFVVLEALAAPVGHIKRRICKDEVRLQVRVQVAMEGVGVLLAEVALNAANGQIHLGQPPGGVVRFLAVDADVADFAAVGLDELFRLDEHAAGAAARVIDPALVRGQHLDQHTDHAAGRVELAALLALGAGELGKEIFIDATQDVPGAVFLVAQADVADQINELAEPLLVEARVGIVLGKHALERGVVTLDGEHGVVDDLADSRLLGFGFELGPARLSGHPKYVDGPVLIGVFRVGSLGSVRFELGALLFEGV